MPTQTEHSQKTPGEMLCEARKSMGLSLADVAAMTRVPKAMLKHLEADRYDEYSAEVFVRGHLRNYAREVQLDPELVLQAFDRHTGNLKTAPELDEEVDEDSSDPSEESEPDHPLGEGDWLDVDFGEVREHVQPAHLVAVGLVLFALLVVFGMLTGQRATAQKPNEFPEASGTASEEWQIEENSKKSRWLLEKSDDSSESKTSE